MERSFGTCTIRGGCQSRSRLPSIMDEELQAVEDTQQIHLNTSKVGFFRWSCEIEWLVDVLSVGDASIRKEKVDSLARPFIRLHE